MIKVVVDIHGGDKSPKELLPGVVEALEANQDLELVVAGNEEIIKSYLESINYSNSRLIILPCTQEVTNYDSPTGILKEKKDSSLVKGMQETINSDAAGIVSCGSTGAVLESAMFILGRINRCRPSLAATLPNVKGELTVLLDCGANIDCKEEHLMGFASMGSALSRAMGNPNPKIGLLNVGTEEKKGNELSKNVHQLLKESSHNFIGNVEASTVLNGEVDVVVTDGFAGNVVLKNIEGVAKTLIGEIVMKMKTTKDESEKKIYGSLVNYFMNKYDFNSKGGAILLGVNKIVVKGHGAANKDTIVAIIDMVYRLAKNDMITTLKNEL